MKRLFCAATLTAAFAAFFVGAIGSLATDPSYTFSGPVPPAGTMQVSLPHPLDAYGDANQDGLPDYANADCDPAPQDDPVTHCPWTPPLPGTSTDTRGIEVKGVYRGETATIRWNCPTGSTAARAPAGFVPDGNTADDPLVPVQGEAQVGPVPSDHAQYPESSMAAAQLDFLVTCVAVTGAGPVDSPLTVRTLVAQRVLASTGGDKAVFTLNCGFSHSDTVDPILFPGDPAGSHLHRFFGFKTLDENTTFETLVAQIGDGTKSSCRGDQNLDPQYQSLTPFNMSAYWVPAIEFLIDDDNSDGIPDAPGIGDEVRETWVQLPGKHVQVYYRNPTPGSLVRAFPPGMNLITPALTSEEQARTFNEQLKYWCTTQGEGGTLAHTGPVARKHNDSSAFACHNRDKVEMQIVFPSCWDGEDVSSGDPRAHLSYAPCPTGWHKLARITGEFTFELPDGPDQNPDPDFKFACADGNLAAPACDFYRPDAITPAYFRLSTQPNGGTQYPWQIHGDYKFGWDQFVIDRFTHECLNSSVDCKRDMPPYEGDDDGL